MTRLRILVLALFAFVLMLPGTAPAQETKGFAVLPFVVNGPAKYQYLSQGVQSMLVSRLTWEDHLTHMDKGALESAGITAPAGKDQAQAALGTLKTDYLVWGSTTILDDQASLDVNVAGTDGVWHTESVQAPLSGLIPALKDVADKINARIFKRQTAAPAPKKAEPVNRMNPDLLFNETHTGQEFYINPQFRYAGGSQTPGRWRSPGLRFVANGMTAADLDGDGVTEMVFISENRVYIYQYDDRRLVLKAEDQPSSRMRMLNVNTIDLNKDGYAEICISAEVEGDPWSLILNYKDGQLVTVAEHLRFYMNVAKLPPGYTPILLGQAKGYTGLFDPNVREVSYMAGGYTLGKRVSLPEKANVFNFAYLPVQGGDYRLVVVNKDDRLLVYTPRNELMAGTEDRYAGSGIGFEYLDALPGLKGVDGDITKSYYIPLRMLAVDLDKDRNYEIIVNKNVSVAAVFFPRYRNFPQGELHSLFWDGVGMSMAWKTRRIKGTVVDYGMGDIDGDGVTELYVCVVSYPGALGVKARKTVLVSYKLDLSKVEPKAQPQADTQ